MAVAQVYNTCYVRHVILTACNDITQQPPAVLYACTLQYVLLQVDVSSDT
jgi:hypothetical protein